MGFIGAPLANVIPIVFAVFSDTSAQGYVANFARPERNVTPTLLATADGVIE
jgi:ABC-type uncharacterized transport system substrate-binding protein